MERLSLLLINESSDDAGAVSSALDAGQRVFEIKTVRTLSRAIQEIRKTAFDVILTGLVLPDSAGSETIARLQEVAQDTAILVLTATEDESAGIDAMRAGAQGYLVKTDQVFMKLGVTLRYAVERKRRESAAKQLQPPEARYRRQMEEALKESQQRLEMISRATNDLIWVFDLKDRSVEGPVKDRTVFGYAFKDIEPHVGWWAERIHPDDREAAGNAFNQAVNSDSNTWTAEFRLRCADGSYAWAFNRAWIVRDENGRAIRLTGALSDITARKDLEQQLIQSQKLEAVGKMAGGIAHDFNNILTVMSGYAQLLLGNGVDDESSRAMLNGIYAAA